MKDNLMRKIRGKDILFKIDANKFGRKCHHCLKVQGGLVVGIVERAIERKIDYCLKK